MLSSQSRKQSAVDVLRLRSSFQDLSSCNFWQSLIAEFVGTFILVFIGLGSCYGSGGVLGAAVAFGFAGALGIWLTAPISGGNINPAVSLGLLVARKMSLLRCLLYWLFQTIGALVASKLIAVLTSEKNTFKGISAGSVTAGRAMLCEVLITFVLVLTVMRMCVEKSRSDTERGVAALAIGISIMVGVLCGAPISGGSMNPARSIGPAVVHRQFKHLWVYIVGPLIGGCLAGLVQQLVLTSELSVDHVKAYVTDPYFDGTPRRFPKADSEKLNDDDLEGGSTEMSFKTPEKKQGDDNNNNGSTWAKEVEGNVSKNKGEETLRLTDNTEA